MLSLCIGLSTTLLLTRFQSFSSTKYLSSQWLQTQIMAELNWVQDVTLACKSGTRLLKRTQNLVQKIKKGIWIRVYFYKFRVGIFLLQIKRLTRIVVLDIVCLIDYWVILFALFECQSPEEKLKVGLTPQPRRKLSGTTGMLYRISCSGLKRFDAFKKQQRVWERFIYILDKFGKETPEGFLVLSKGFL